MDMKKNQESLPLIAYQFEYHWALSKVNFTV